MRWVLRHSCWKGLSTWRLIRWLTITTLYNTEYGKTQSEISNIWERILLQRSLLKSTATESMGFISGMIWWSLILVINIWRAFSCLQRSILEANWTGNEIQSSCLEYKQLHPHSTVQFSVFSLILLLLHYSRHPFSATVICFSHTG